MLIAGLEKSSLLDYAGKISSVIFTYGCNLRCEYCHNPELVIHPCRKEMIIPEREVFKFLESRIGLIDGVVITGGEPTIQPDLIPFIKKIKDLNYLVKLDTNGTNPTIIKEIISLNIVDYWAMDVKYSKELYKQKLTENIDYKDIEESINLIKDNAKDYEFRTTFVKEIHSIDTAKEIGRIIKGSKKYYIQNFRPGKTINPNLTNSNSFTQKELEELREIMIKYVKKVEIRN
ncbi:anaerobic ribonucleoside-triphosphate reductase activating protein [Candidatus Dojkabacteria bacterium]|uniref:Anaerobic ribonucleoside-triphosphate reductase activating protein n=1 Tax=Candidatus Dojkabacteria bacterium TaxID=2099670 RepID=A0A847VDD9_9BACT|nr:anaerobic ribonucleoside-triphosphate reductase activating protein [Candidatus Dojkabacteria bacterium]